MADNSTQSVPPVTRPAHGTSASGGRWARRSAAVALAATLVACSGGDDDTQAATTVSAETTAVATTTTSTTVAPTTTTSTSTSTTTTSTTTTTAPTTTEPEISAGDEADLTALLMLGDLRDGTNPELTRSFADILEPFPLERVDVVSGRLTDDGIADLVIAATSGYGTDDFQVEALIDAVNTIADLWELDPFAGIGTIKVGLDISVDGRQFRLSNDDMLAILNRQRSAADVLGL